MLKRANYNKAMAKRDACGRWNNPSKDWEERKLDCREREVSNRLLHSKMDLNLMIEIFWRRESKTDLLFNPHASATIKYYSIFYFSLFFSRFSTLRWPSPDWLRDIFFKS